MAVALPNSSAFFHHKTSGYTIRHPVQMDCAKNEKLTDFCRSVLSDRYLYKSSDYQETEYQELFARVAGYYADDAAHAQRMYEHMSNLHFMPATPILSNGGTDRGLPISCFLNETEDSLEGIVNLWMENVWLSAKGGGIGSYWGNLRSIGQPVRNSGQTSGIIPFVVVQNALTLAISQGSLRRGSAAVYLPVWHPEIHEFLDIRKPTGGDPCRKALNLHNAVIIDDKFMEAVEQGSMYSLLDPMNNREMEQIDARELWIKLLATRVDTGEPYFLFIDTVREGRSEVYKRLDLDVKTSNLCNEITLATGKDHLGNHRSGVCCLSSLNLEHYDIWRHNKNIIPDAVRFLDNVLEDFITKAPDSMSRAKYSAMRERSLGLGCMGFHSLLQKRMVPFESGEAKRLNIEIFNHIKQQCDEASRALADEKGPCPDAQDCNVNARCANVTAIAPTASISIIANTSPGIEPYVANTFTHKTLTGSFTVRNKFLEELLEKKGMNIEKVWSMIASNQGSVQHLDCLTPFEKAVFKTAFEIDQHCIIDMASDRARYICQSQSINLFLHSDINKSYLHALHMAAWKKKLKGLYYCRSASLQRPDKVSHPVLSAEHVSKDGLKNNTELDLTHNNTSSITPNMLEECTSCQ